MHMRAARGRSLPYRQRARGASARSASLEVRNSIVTKCVEVRGVKIGEGMPKIIVPIVGRTKREILEAASSIMENALKGNGSGVNDFWKNVFDLVEWRADWFEDVFEFGKVEDVLKELREKLGNIPLLFTFRTAREGGEKAISVDAYKRLNIMAAKTGLVDLIDVEAFTGDDVVREIIEEAHKAGVKVVGSNHDFDKTPEKEEIVRRLRRMQELGADIPKIAVMPRGSADVLTLIAATQEMSSQYADRPIITMSMSGTGLVSRLCGEVFGSSCTFGTVGKASAPGQIGAEELGGILRVIHKNL